MEQLESDLVRELSAHSQVCSVVWIQVLYPLAENTQDEARFKEKNDLEMERLLRLVGLGSVLLQYSLDGKPTEGSIPLSCRSFSDPLPLSLPHSHPSRPRYGLGITAMAIVLSTMAAFHPIGPCCA